MRRILTWSNGVPLAIALAGLAATTAGAQDGGADDGTLQESINDIERQAESAGEDRRVSSENQASEPEEVPGLTTVNRQPVLREGAFLRNAVGSARRDPRAGYWEFVPEGQETQAMPRAFVLLPCSALELIQETVEASELEVVFRLSGRIYVYKNRNYLLPAGPAQLDQYRPTPPVAPDPEPTSLDETGDDPSAEEIMESLRNEVPLPMGLESSGNDADAEASPEMTSEDSLVVSRRGRVSRSPYGAWTFEFDADASGLADPPMTLLPCLLLERIERIYGTGGSGAAVELSGRVYAFHGHNYMLPTVYRVVRERPNLR